MAPETSKGGTGDCMQPSHMRCVTYTNDQNKSCLAQIITSKGGTIDCRQPSSGITQISGNLLKTLFTLKREENLVDVEVNQALGGHQPAPQRRQYAALDTRIVTLVRDYGNCDVLDYLRGIEHNLSF